MVLEGATDEGERLYNVYTSIPGGVWTFVNFVCIQS